MPVRCRPRFPSRNRRFPDRCRSPDCASTAFRCRCLLLRQKLFVLPCRRLRNNYILCPTGTPTHCGASRRNGRDLIIAKNDQRTSPYPHCCQRQRRRRYKQSPEPATIPTAPIPRSQHRQICTCPPRAKGPLDRRSKNPSRAMADSDFLRILAGITFHHRCQTKGLCLRSPALTRPLASATAGVFRSYRHPPKPSPRVAHPLKPSP